MRLLLLNSGPGATLACGDDEEGGSEPTGAGEAPAADQEATPAVSYTHLTLPTKA